MKFRRRKLACTLAWTTGVSGALTLGAMRADAADVMVEVTGSHIKRAVSEGALPVQTITREEIAKSGAQTAYEILNNVSAVMGYAGVNEQLSNRPAVGSLGFAGVSLRGLGVDRTLILLNGRRIATYSLGRGFPGVDLNAIPTAVLDRVEILKDGASAIYGTDAIAGVINFITRKEFSGGEILGYHASPQDPGGAQTRGTLTVGHGDASTDKFNAWLSFDYLKNQALMSSDRPFARTAYLPGFAARASITSYPANVLIPGRVDGVDYYPGIGARNPSDPTPNAGSDVLSPVCAPPISFPTGGPGGFPHQCRYDTARDISIVTPSTRYNVFGRAMWQISPDLQAFAEGSYTRNEFTNFGSVPLVDANVDRAWMLPASSPYYPTAWLQANYPAAVGQPLAIYWRPVEIGGGVQEATSEQERVVAGFKGAIRSWDFDAAFNYNRSKVSYSYNGGYLDQRIFLPLFQTGVVNPFGPNTPEVLAQMRAAEIHQEVQRTAGTVKSIDFKTSGDVVQLSSGPLALALGGEYRKEDLSQWRADVVAFQVGTAGAIPTPLPSDRTVGSLFAEAYVPIVKNLDAQVAVRYDNYSDFGSTTNPKLALRWQPAREVLLRGSWNKGFHAPSLLELYQPRYITTGLAGADDPLRCPTTSEPRDCGRLRPIERGGNPSLQPETSKQWSLGLVLDPADGISMSVDWFRIELRDVLAQRPESFFRTAMLDPNSPYVVRAPRDDLDPDLPGEVLYWIGPTQNIAQKLVEGIDVDLTARSPKSPLGQLTARLNGTYLTKYRISADDGSFPDIVGTRGDIGIGPVPQWKHVLTFDWALGPWNATLIENYTHSYSEACATTAAGVILDATGCATRKVPAYETWDLSAGYTGFKNTTLRLGIKNVLNRNPPLSSQSTTTHIGWDPSYTDPRGRAFYGSVRYVFK